jgi:cytochrome c peroxidase
MPAARMILRIIPTIAITVVVSAGAAAATAVVKDEDYRVIPRMLVPTNNEITPARVSLGKTLFFDPRLSRSNWISCASCHNPALGWSDGLPTAMGDGMKQLNRATPTIVNAAHAKILMWDGREDSLESQALGPVRSKDEMNLDPAELVIRLSAIPGYRDMFARAYPGEGINESTIARAIASFERTVISTNTPFDRWQRGDGNAVSASAKRGFALFRGKAKCEACHQGFNFTDDGFHNIGLKTRDGMPEDEGRYAQRKVKSMKGAFKTPTLREIALTAPYMHNGIYRTLEEVVDHYDRGGDVKDNLDPNMTALNLTAREKADLVEFMKTLTSPRTEVSIPRLPQ